MSVPNRATTEQLVRGRADYYNQTMRLGLDLPRDWLRREAPGRDLYVVCSEPWLTVEVGPLVETPDLPDDLIGRGLAPTQRLTGLRELPHRTKTGWPVHLQEALLCDPSGAVVEVRLVAAYTFLVYATAVLVRAADPDILESHRAAIIEVLESARPVLRGGPPAAIAELWSMQGAP